MKKVIKSIMIFAGVLVVVGTAGSLEMDTVTISQAIFRMLTGSAIAGGGWLFGELAEVYSVVKKGRVHRERKHNIIEFKYIA